VIPKRWTLTWSDPTRTYFWAVVNKGPTQLDGIFFRPEEKKIEKFGIFRENFTNQEVADPTQTKRQKTDLTWLGSKKFELDPWLVSGCTIEVWDTLVFNSNSPGQKIFHPAQVGSTFCCSGRVRSAIFGLGLDFENFPLKSQIYQFFPLQIKENHIRLGQKVLRSKIGRHLIYYKSKVCSGRVGSGQGPSL